MSEKQRKSLQKKLNEIAPQLKTPQLQSLLDFAQFLGEQHGIVEEETVTEPQPIDRPDQESVVAAIKRLSATYPMLDKGKMLQETSSLVAAHVMQGREATEVIDELEEVFYNHYQKLKSQRESS